MPKHYATSRGLSFCWTMPGSPGAATKVCPWDAQEKYQGFTHMARARCGQEICEFEPRISQCWLFLLKPRKAIFHVCRLIELFLFVW